MWDLAKYSNKVAIVSEDKKITYRNIYNFTKDLYSKTQSRKLILFVCDNSLSSYLGYISFIFNNDIQIILDETNKNNYLEILNKYKPNYIWCKKRIITKLKKNLKSVFNFSDYHLFKYNNKDIEIHSDLLLLCTSSGTTGNPKFIKQSFKNIKSNTKSIIEYQNLNSSYTSITTLPLSYTYGMSCINTLLAVGGKMVVTKNSIIQREFWDLFKNNKINIFNGVPFTYKILKKLKYFNKPNNIKIFTQAGGKLSNEMQLDISTFCKKNKSKFFIMYGQAEATTRISYLPNLFNMKKIGSVGIAVKGGQIQIRDENMKLIRKKNKIGDIFYKGPNVFMGYSFSKIDLIRDYKWKKGLDTGDIGRLDEDNFLYITGRKKRFAKLYGLSINLDDIERIILQVYKTVDLAVISENNKIKIFYNNKKLKLKIIKLIVNKININQNSFELFFLKKMPKLYNDKTDYENLKSRYFSR